MPVFESKTLDSAFEGQALLAALLHPTRAERVRALTHGRRRAKRAALLADPMTLEVRHPCGAAGDLAATPISAT